MEFQDPEIEQYFSSLPKLIQESIAQSGVVFQSKKQIQRFVEYLQSNQ